MSHLNSCHLILDFRYLLHRQREAFDFAQQAPFGAYWEYPNIVRGCVASIPQTQPNGAQRFIADVANHALESKWSQKQPTLTNDW
ncbi:hypothetical protein GCM10009085_52980 [Pseudomonas avellanae]|nr:hypothetical protein GCM10009085_52980 [Pseudomonas avellanae]